MDASSPELELLAPVVDGERREYFPHVRALYVTGSYEVRIQPLGSDFGVNDFEERRVCDSVQIVDTDSVIVRVV